MKLKFLSVAPSNNKKATLRVELKMNFDSNLISSTTQKVVGTSVLNLHFQREPNVRGTFSLFVSIESFSYRLNLDTKTDSCEKGKLERM